MPRQKTKPQYDAEVFELVDAKGKWREIARMVAELVKTYFGSRLGLGDGLPVLRHPGKPVGWKAKVVRVPACLRSLIGDRARVNTVLLVDRDWWQRAESREQQGVLQSCLAQIAKEKALTVYPSVVQAQGGFTQELEDMGLHVAKQLKLLTDEALDAFKVPKVEPEVKGANGKQKQPRAEKPQPVIGKIGGEAHAAGAE
jgi:hypothetical protein